MLFTEYDLKDILLIFRFLKAWQTCFLLSDCASRKKNMRGWTAVQVARITFLVIRILLGITDPCLWTTHLLEYFLHCKVLHNTFSPCSRLHMSAKNWGEFFFSLSTEKWFEIGKKLLSRERAEILIWEIAVFSLSSIAPPPQSSAAVKLCQVF